MGNNLYLYMGIFCVCTGFLMPLGLILIGVYFYNDYTSKYVAQINFEKSEYSPQVRDNLI